MTLATAFTQDPTAPHYHQCGRMTGGIIPGYGCGYVWRHQGPKPKSTIEYMERHMCPDCGRGPWYYVLSIEEVESAHTVAV